MGVDMLEVAQSVVDANVAIELVCSRCTHVEMFTGTKDGDAIKRAVTRGWRKLGTRPMCKKCARYLGL
jgi:hypothetical protein